MPLSKKNHAPISRSLSQRETRETTSSGSKVEETSSYSVIAESWRDDNPPCPLRVSRLVKMWRPLFPMKRFFQTAWSALVASDGCPSAFRSLNRSSKGLRHPRGSRPFKRAGQDALVNRRRRRRHASFARSPVSRVARPASQCAAYHSTLANSRLSRSQVATHAAAQCTQGCRNLKLSQGCQFQMAAT